MLWQKHSQMSTILSLRSGVYIFEDVRSNMEKMHFIAEEIKLLSNPPSTILDSQLLNLYKFAFGSLWNSWQSSVSKGSRSCSSRFKWTCGKDALPFTASFMVCTKATACYFAFLKFWNSASIRGISFLSFLYSGAMQCQTTAMDAA